MTTTIYRIALNGTNTELTEEQYNAYEEISNQLGTLTGSEKQIAWASDIRNSFLAQIIKLSRVVPEAQKPAMAAFFSKPTEARFWIDNRYESVMTIGKKLRNF